MVVSRRGFMKRGSLLVLAAGATLSSADRIFGRDAGFEYPRLPQDDLPPKGNKSAVFNFTKATFTPYVDTVFRIYPDSSKALKTTLVSVGDVGPVQYRLRGEVRNRAETRDADSFAAQLRYLSDRWLHV